MFDVYCYDADTGNVAGAYRNATADQYTMIAMGYNGQGYCVKVVDQANGAVVYTLS